MKKNILLITPLMVFLLSSCISKVSGNDTPELTEYTEFSNFFNATCKKYALYIMKDTDYRVYSFYENEEMVNKGRAGKDAYIFNDGTTYFESDDDFRFIYNNEHYSRSIKDKNTEWLNNAENVKKEKEGFSFKIKFKDRDSSFLPSEVYDIFSKETDLSKNYLNYNVIYHDQRLSEIIISGDSLIESTKETFTYSLSVYDYGENITAPEIDKDEFLDARNDNEFAEYVYQEVMENKKDADDFKVHLVKDTVNYNDRNKEDVIGYIYTDEEELLSSREIRMNEVYIIPGSNSYNPDYTECKYNLFGTDIYFKMKITYPDYLLRTEKSVIGYNEKAVITPTAHYVAYTENNKCLIYNNKQELLETVEVYDPSCLVKEYQGNLYIADIRRNSNASKKDYGASVFYIYDAEKNELITSPVVDGAVYDFTVSNHGQIIYSNFYKNIHMLSSDYQTTKIIQFTDENEKPVFYHNESTDEVIGFATNCINIFDTYYMYYYDGTDVYISRNIFYEEGSQQYFEYMPVFYGEYGNYILMGKGRTEFSGYTMTSIEDYKEGLRFCNEKRGDCKSFSLFKDNMFYIYIGNTIMAYDIEANTIDWQCIGTKNYAYMVLNDNDEILLYNTDTSLFDVYKF